MGKSYTSIEDVAKQLEINLSQSSQVNLDCKKIDSLCKHIGRRPEFTEYETENWDNSLFWNAEDSLSDRSQFFAIGNAINFRYWTSNKGTVVPAEGIKKGQKLIGAMYMWRCLRICLNDKLYPLLDASFLANISDAEFRDIFSTDGGDNLLEVGIGDRLTNLRDLGRKLLAKWDGLFFNVVKASRNSLVKFAKLSREFIAYDDPLYKLTMVNAILHSGSGIVEFDGDLLPGIDYQLLKQLLRIGILLPTPILAKKLKRGQILEGQEADELRRVALKAFILMSRKTGISGEILDNKWWQNRRKCTDVSPVCIDEKTAPQCPFYGPCNRQIEFTIPLEITRYY